MIKIPTHQKALAQSVVGWGSSFDAQKTAAIDRAMGMANDRAETRTPVRECANHRSLWPCSDT